MSDSRFEHRYSTMFILQGQTETNNIMISTELKATVLLFEIKLSNMLVRNSNCNFATALSDQWNVRAIHITDN